MTKQKAIWETNVWISNSIGFETRYFIFEISSAKHKRLKKYATNGYYWFNGLRGNDWFSGGYFHKPLINPKADVLQNSQGFTDGKDVFLLREVLTNSELSNKYSELQIDAMKEI